MLELADTTGSAAFGFQPGEIKSSFQFPKERETQAVAREASDLLDKLKKTHGENLNGIITSNAVVTFRGKPTPIRDVMATAGVLATDDKGAPVMPAPKPPSVNVGSFEDYTLRYAKERNKKPEDLTTAELEDARKRYNQSDDRPRITVQTGQPGGLPAAVQRRVDAKTRGFESLPIVKKVQIVAETVAFADSLSNSTTNPADDQALIYAFAKANDPESAVREGEYATIQKYAQSLAQRYGFNAARVFSNTAFLTPQARADMKRTIRQKYAATRTQYDNVRRSYASQVNRITGRNDGDDYLTDYGGGFPSVEGEQPASGGAFTVTAPDGKPYSFPTQAALDEFKKKAGIR
jgi:hypothetical protein